MTSKKISLKDIKPQQWKAIEELHEDILWNQQIQQFSDEEITEEVKEKWKELGFSPPKEVVILRSPEECVQKYAEESGECREKIIDSSYISFWWRAWVGWYDGAAILGVKFSDELEKLRSWVYKCPFIILDDDRPFVSRNPIKVHWEDGVLQNSDGPAIEFADGFKLYALEGMHIPEKVVMAPQTQTIEEINSESNEEIKRIRIERFGWENYLVAINAEQIDERENAVDGTLEVLFRVNEEYNVILCSCASTGRVYGLPVDPQCITCESSQKYLNEHEDGQARNCILAT